MLSDDMRKGESVSSVFLGYNVLSTGSKEYPVSRKNMRLAGYKASIVSARDELFQACSNSFFTHSL